MKIQIRPILMIFKPYVLHTKQGRFPEFQLLLPIVRGCKGRQQPSPLKIQIGPISMKRIGRRERNRRRKDEREGWKERYKKK